MSTLSVIIPSYNRAASLQACLQALAQQTLPAAEFEVVVVVDGSTDATRSVLAGLTVPYRLHICWQANGGQCAARNRGAAEATGRICVFLDDDILAEPGLLAAHAAAHHRRSGVVGIGRLTMKPPPNASGFTRAFAQMFNTHYDRLGQAARPAGWRDCYSGNLSVERGDFSAVGGFAEDLPAGFDIELGYRLEQRGLQWVYVPEAAGEHRDYKSFAALAADEVRQGQASVEIARRHPAMLPRLLGTFGEATPRARLLCGLLLAVPMPMSWLGWLSRVLAQGAWAYPWYAFLHSYFYWRGVRQALPERAMWRRLTYRTPILMYHAFGSGREPASRFVLPGGKFALQMAWLKWWGYRVISLDEYVSARRAYQLLPERTVVITIDDGFADILTQALPTLERYGFPAVVFIVSALVGGTSHWDLGGPLVGRALLTGPDIQHLLRGRISVGAHTRTHPQLTMLSTEQAQAEISGARFDLEQTLARPVRLFAYPFGKYDASTVAQVEQAGYLAACGVHRGANTLNTPIFDLRRIEVSGTDSLLRFGLALWLGDDALPPRRRPVSSAAQGTTPARESAS